MAATKAVTLLAQADSLMYARAGRLWLMIRPVSRSGTASMFTITKPTFRPRRPLPRSAPRVALGLALLGLFTLALSGCSEAVGKQPGQGSQAPAFRLQDQNDQWHELSDYSGQWLVMFFYPKADTPGCTTEACAFRDDIFKFKKLGAKIIGVSLDDVKSQKEFADKYHLPFPLLSDADQHTAKAYGVLKNLGVTSIAKRQTFVIAPDGTIAAHYEKVDPESHSVEVLKELERLMPEK